MNRIEQSSRRLPLGRLDEVLQFVRMQSWRTGHAEGARGSAEAILPALDGFRFEPGELAELTAACDAARHVDFRGDDPLPA